MDDFEVNLWIFPPADFADWCKLVGTPQVGNHAGYMTLLAAVQADLERQGLTVRRVKMTVAEMRAALAEHGWPNTPDYRAAVIAARTD
ncbi:MAG: hypothetical protein L0Z50_38560 [Verrucomicrobiales bacterium]|nr:hypothetical protein [Verrucomicrobiales bacterium]